VDRHLNNGASDNALGARYRSHRMWVSLWAVAYGMLHHLGTLLGPLDGGPGAGTRWADWIDLVVPFAVLVPAAGALHAAGATPGRRLIALAGAILYANGHGIHLAANSINKSAPGPLADFWDENAGHLLWYAGFWIVAAVLLDVLRDLPITRRGLPLAVALAAGVGVTHATNAHGGTAPLPAVGAVVAVAFCVAGLRLGTTLGRCAALAAVIAFVGITVGSLY
jgi:hypothetical protein